MGCSFRAVSLYMKMKIFMILNKDVGVVVFYNWNRNNEYGSEALPSCCHR